MMRVALLVTPLLTPLLTVGLASTLAAAESPVAESVVQSGRPDVVLITLDTVRADVVGRVHEAGREAWSGVATPVLDGLATRGTRYRNAISASPLTLPAHASLLTGLGPLAHGARVNGTVALGPGVMTLAAELGAHGYDTAAFVASRVLDRRFGLDRGFDHYDDHMLAERVGEYGYPERDAAAVTDAALAWLDARGAQDSASDADSASPLFLWVHYYDAHAPYDPPARFRAGPNDDDRRRYAGEVAYVDEQLGRLLRGLRGAPDHRIVAVVGDHGEAFGEHGERGHGLFLYGEVLNVPLLLVGRGVPRGGDVTTRVASQQVASTLVRLATAGESALGGPMLPGLGRAVPDGAALGAIYSETLLPETAFGWSPLKAITEAGWRLIVAPRAELYDLGADPLETVNRLDNARRPARRLQQSLARFEREAPGAGVPVAPDAALAAELRQLGYLDGGSGGGERSGLDPKDGLALLDKLEAGRRLMAQGDPASAMTLLAALVAESPGNVPFLGAYGAAALAAGRGEEAIKAFESALVLNPRLEFLHHRLAQAHVAMGQLPLAEAALGRALALDRRYAAAWLTLAELAHRRGDPAAESKILGDAVSAGADSAAVLLRLAQLADAAGTHVLAERHLQGAVALAPTWALAWLEQGRFLLRRGRHDAARVSLERARELEPQTPLGREAARLLAGLSAATERH